jgi:hypothetical protein
MSRFPGYFPRITAAGLEMLVEVGSPATDSALWLRHREKPGSGVVAVSPSRIRYPESALRS